MRKLILTAFFAPAVAALEVDTHGLETQTAFNRSVLTTDSALLQRLGFDRLDLSRPYDVPGLAACGVSGANPTRDAYVDARGAWLSTLPAPDIGSVYFRCPTLFERRIMPVNYSGRIPTPPALGNTPQLRMEAWLMRGVIREDDLNPSSYADPNDRPDSDPWGDLDRPRYHFYSPVTNSSDGLLTLSALPWAFGVADPFAASPAPDTNRINHFSYADATRDLFLALTYKQDEPVNQVKSRADAAVRLSLFAGTLKSLGHVIHLLQDTSSTQHARGEAHNYVCRGFYSFFNQDVANRTYENFTNYRVTSAYNQQVLQAGSRDFYIATNACEEKQWLDMFDDGGARPAPSSLPFQSTTYPIPSFSLAREFFTTRAANDPTDPASLPLATLNARAGLADYSNRGFFTQDNQQGHYQSPPSINDPSMVIGPVGAPISVPGLGELELRAVYWKVPDVVSPTFPDPGLDAQGRAPIASASFWSTHGVSGLLPHLSLANYTQMGDMLGPRAIAYSAGLINYFFRGKLEVTPTAQNAFAVLNQGETHTVDAEGYPRRLNGTIFGFEKVRLKVRNVSDAITESGPVTPVIPQTSGSGTLVAVARYHRNACYKPDMTGERVRGYAAPPGIGTIVEPTCTGATPVRTDYQEISISAPLTIASAADLPGGEGVGGPAAAVEKMFDFSADPIPVNATDLFIQVVYRGRLGDEVDGIAVGNYDVREPSFIGIYNNTDYYWNGTVTQWLGHFGSQFPWQNADYVRVCTGSSTESRWAYHAEPVAGFPPLGIPSPDPGVIRLAVIFAKPNGAQTFAVRVTPVMADALDAFQRSFFTPASQKQANKELIDAAVMNAPQFCTQTAPTGSTYWCDDPISKRRGLALGHVVAGVYYDTGFGNTGGDVDAQPLPQFAGLRLTATGTVKWNDATLVACPPPQTAVAGSVELIELLEQAADEGILVE